MSVLVCCSAADAARAAWRTSQSLCNSSISLPADCRLCLLSPAESYRFAPVLDNQRGNGLRGSTVAVLVRRSAAAVRSQLFDGQHTRCVADHRQNSRRRVGETRRHYGQAAPVWRQNKARVYRADSAVGLNRSTAFRRMYQLLMQ